MTKADAEVIALRALTWLAGNDELWPVFLGATGAAASDLRSRASDPAFLAAVLDFVAAADATVVAFCTDAEVDFQAPLAARHALSGGDVHWT